MIIHILVPKEHYSYIYHAIKTVVNKYSESDFPLTYTEHIASAEEIITDMFIYSPVNPNRALIEVSYKDALSKGIETIILDCFLDLNL